MKDATLYSWHEYPPDKQALVRSIWQRHFLAPTTNCSGLVASTFEVDDERCGQAHVSLDFSDTESLLAFETSVAYAHYIWEVLPFLNHKPVMTTSMINRTTSEAIGNAGRAEERAALRRPANNLFEVLAIHFNFHKTKNKNKTAS